MAAKKKMCASSREERSPIYTLELLQKFNFQPSTIKLDNIGHPTIENSQIWPLGGFEGGFHFS